MEIYSSIFYLTHWEMVSGYRTMCFLFSYFLRCSLEQRFCQDFQFWGF